MFHVLSKKIKFPKWGYLRNIRLEFFCQSPSHGIDLLISFYYLILKSFSLKTVCDLNGTLSDVYQRGTKVWKV